mgnify:CR=1 FL=1
MSDLSRQALADTKGAHALFDVHDVGGNGDAAVGHALADVLGVAMLALGNLLHLRCDLPARAKSICVTSLGSICVLIGTAPFVGITHIRFAGQGGAPSQPAVFSCKLPVMSWAQV